MPSFRVAAATGESEAPEEPSQRLRQMQLFCATGLRAEWMQPAEPARLLPATLQPLRDPGRFRSDFPVCLVDEHPAARLVALGGFLDALVEDLAPEIGGNGEGREALQHALSRIESILRSRVESEGAIDLSDAWNQAAVDVVTSLRSRASSESLPRVLETAGSRLPSKSRLLPCSRQSLHVLFGRVASEMATERAFAAAQRTESLRTRLRHLLEADQARSPEAIEPDRLQRSVGSTDADEIDFGQLSQLLRETPLARGLEDSQRSRVTELLDKLEASFERLYPSTARPAGQNGSAAGSVSSSLDKAQRRLGVQIEALVDYVRAARVGDLEIEHRYAPERHDAFFGSYSWDRLTSEERALLPPVTIHLPADSLDLAGIGPLLQTLATDRPIKVLVSFERISDPQTAAPALVARLGDMALQLPNVFVAQSTASDLAGLQQIFQEGLAFDGPALFCVYVGPAQVSGSLASMLRAAAGVEGRALPAYDRHPERGTAAAERMRLLDIGTPDAVWPTGQIGFELESGEVAPHEIAFTYADFLFVNEGFESDFALIPPGAWVDAMAPLDVVLTSGPGKDSDAVPYIWLADEQGVLHRAIVASRVVNAGASIQERWRLLREVVGIDNPHARRAAAEAALAFETQKQEEIAALKQQHEESLARATGELAEVIVGNIASSLLDLSPGTTVAGPSAPLPRPVKAPAAPAEAPADQAAESSTEPAVAEEEEELNLDEAYVETPRCTSCNECTTINGQLFAYNENKQAYIKDLAAGSYRELVMAAEKCPVAIIHPGKPINPEEPHLEELLERAARFR